MRGFIFVVLFLSLCTSGMAEFRIWTDKNGDHLEAEFVCISAGKIVLQDRNNRKYRLLPESLSEKDRKYAALLVPPRLDLNVSKSKDTRSIGYDSEEEMLICKVTVKKTSSQPYPGDLTAELMVIGKELQSGDYIVLAKAKETFRLGKSGDFYELSSERIRLQKYEGYYHESGTEYSGFLTVVRDPEGRVIAIKASRDTFEKKAEELLKIPVRRRFDKNCRELKSSNRFY